MEQQTFLLGSSKFPSMGPWLPVGFLFFFLALEADFFSKFLSESFFDFSLIFGSFFDFSFSFDLLDFFGEFSGKFLSGPFFDFSLIFDSFFLSLIRHWN